MLENYSDDPRYTFNWHHFAGSIFLRDEYWEYGKIKPRDKTFLEHFGLGFRERDGQRVASGPLIYLARLTPEHQQGWKTQEKHSESVMDPDYYRPSICGEWSDNVPIYDALLHEIDVINRMCAAAGFQRLLECNFLRNNPKELGIPLRNTKEAFHASVEELDKILSHNLSKKFSKFVLPPNELYERVYNACSRSEKTQDLGTITPLKRWIGSRFRFENENECILAMDELNALSEVRKIRQFLAHKIEGDKHGCTFSDMHDQIVRKAYAGVRAIRLIFTNHPLVRDTFECPGWLTEGRIRLFKWNNESTQTYLAQHLYQYWPDRMSIEIV